MRTTLGWIIAAIFGASLCAGLASAQTRTPPSPTNPSAPPNGINVEPTDPKAFSQKLKDKITPREDRVPAVGLSQLNKITVFGSNLFSGPKRFATTSGISRDYRITKGDKIQIWVWGAVDLQTLAEVDGQGNIFLPKVGPIKVEGLSFSQLNAAVLEAVKRVYTTNIRVYTTLPAAQPVGVFVTGGVKNPGRYPGQSIDSVLHFMAQAGGIDLNRGSFRKIAIKRHGRVVYGTDLYDFLLAGRLKPFQFQDGDTILVGPKGPSVRVAGAVLVKAAFELTQKAVSGKSIIFYARPVKSATHVFIRGERDGRVKQWYLPVDKFKSFRVVGSDDVVFVRDLIDRQIGVSIDGPVLGQSLFSLRKGTSLKHLLYFIKIDPQLAQLDAIHIRRKSVAETQKDILRENIRRLQEALFKTEKLSKGEIEIRVKEADLLKRVIEAMLKIEPTGIVVLNRNGRLSDLSLEDGDIIVIPRKTDIVYIGGEVVAPQTFRYAKGKRPRDYIKQVGGLTDLGKSDKFVIYRNSGAVIIGDNAPLRPGDKVVFLPYIRTNILQVALDISEVFARALILGRVAGVF